MAAVAAVAAVAVAVVEVAAVVAVARSRAAQETRTGVEGETTQGRPTELLTKPRRSREARKPQSSRWTCHNIHIHAKYE